MPMTLLFCDLITSSSKLYFWNLTNALCDKMFSWVQKQRFNPIFSTDSSCLLNISLLCRFIEGRHTICGHIGFKGWFQKKLRHFEQIVYIFGITTIPFWKYNLLLDNRLPKDLLGEHWLTIMAYIVVEFLCWNLVQ